MASISYFSELNSEIRENEVYRQMTNMTPKAIFFSSWRRRRRLFLATKSVFNENCIWIVDDVLRTKDQKLAIMKAAMDNDKKTKIQYASKYASISNYWKYYIGQSKGLKSMKVYDKKKSIENSFESWVLEDSTRIKNYGYALDLIESAYRKNNSIELTRIYLNEAIFGGAEIMVWSWWISEEIKNLPKEELERKIAIRKIKEQANDFYKDYNSSLDEELFASMLEMYYYNVPQKHH